MPTIAALNLQNSSSPLMEQLSFFHDYAMTFIILIMSIVAFNMASSLSNKMMNAEMTESHHLELFWTVSPSFILIALGLPSIRLLYLLDEVFNPSITIKTLGHQWYWSYEYTDFLNIEFDSYIKPLTQKDQFRLLETDNQLFIPINSQVRNLISAADVLHSWTIPSLGVKVDAVPGRLNQINFLPTIIGKYFGQCSEICGTNHSFMPINLNIVSPNKFISWIKSVN
uniref:Cytochrome c oxidase subunit 2 n=1 Tax=Megalothorax incertus TaxID=2579793 RepID=A0A8E8GTT7_9HEXA|nr:cytochrome c oxidase subunit II [Megalothorax incertus]